MHDAHTTPWRLISFELFYMQPQQSALYLPASEFGANFKLSNQFCRNLYKHEKEKVKSALKLHDET
jgi:hypothetical protein